jgi:hypothetical protein
VLDHNRNSNGFLELAYVGIATWRFVSSSVIPYSVVPSGMNAAIKIMSCTWIVIASK